MYLLSVLYPCVVNINNNWTEINNTASPCVLYENALTYLNNVMYFPALLQGVFSLTNQE